MRARLVAATSIGFGLAALGLVVVSTLAPDSASADQTAPKEITCEEKIPKGAKRPKIKERFPGEIIAGFEAPLELEIRHGKGETPLPSGFKLSSGSKLTEVVAEAGFILAEPDGSTGVTIETTEEGNGAVSKVRIPFVVAPVKSGTQSLTLPQMPLSIGRANGDTMTVCTQLHLVTALDPTAGEEDPKPRPNPDGRQQREDWPFMKVLAWILLGLLILAALISWWVRRQLKKPVPAPLPVRRLPWEEALTELQALSASPLLEEGREGGPKRAELFDKVSDTLRKYLGARYGFEGLGFDGLETTTDEMMSLLRRVRPAVPSLELVEAFLSECDLVKFARVVPEVQDCKLAIERAEKVVHATIPTAPPQVLLHDPNARPAAVPVAPPPVPADDLKWAPKAPPAPPPATGDPTTPSSATPEATPQPGGATFKIPGRHVAPPDTPPEDKRS